MISLRILAEDNGSPKRRSNPATLRLKSFKDVEPQFEIHENRIELIETDMSEKFHLISFEFPAAFDPNNRDPPATPEGGWTDQSIFYQINSSSSNLFVIEDPLINRVRVTENLDYDCATCSPAFTFTISASNKKDEPNFDKPFSVQQVTVAVMDINDNIPEFIGLPNYFVLESATQCADCRIEAFDKDTSIDKMLSFEITNITVSDPSLKGTGFNIKNFTETAPIATLEPDFTCCAAGMTGNYDVEVQVTDNVGHTSSTHVKVVVMTEQNNVTFGFDNAVDDICRHRESIMNIFLKVLGWSFTEKDPLNCVPGREADSRASSITEFDGYFVDPDTFKPKSQREIAAMYDQKFEELWLELKHQLNISLDGRQGFRGETTEQDPLVGTNFALIVIGGICAALIVATAAFLLVAYCVRTKALERRVKAIDTDAVEGAGEDKEAAKKPTDKIFLAGLTDAVPGSNEFADQGANPIWKEAMESNDFEEDFKFEDDAMSESSGDSILIGVEDQTEFNDYTEKMREIEVDMDLYSKLQGNRYKTLDEYQGPEEGLPGSSGGRNPLFDDEDDA